MNAQKFITEANIRKVCQLLNWSIEDYTNYQQNQGLQYLLEVICCDEWSVNQVAKSGLFWKWWINHWNSRDAQFIGDAWQYPNSWLERKYKEFNDLKEFNYYPQRVIMEQTYALMIQELNKEAVAV